ncbi:hypothetical protein MWU59_12335 [Flavobacteriaceae bacterium F08102]|nr:hypothetical protein [Flavobacteriaceae bacterium F08102]
MQSESESNTSFSAIAERLKHLFETSMEYFQLKVFQQLVFTMSAFTKIIFIGSLILFGFVFLCISAAIAIGEALASAALGYLIVSGIIFLLAGLLFALRKFIDRKIIRKFSAVFFNKNH